MRASDAEPTERLADVYVATTGDDANTGADAEHPMKSVNNALARVAENGTVHLADGVYRESVALAVPDVKLVGESRDGTVVEPEVSALEQESGKYMTYNWAVGFFEHGISVSNLTVRNAYSGFFTQKRSYGDGSRLDNCVSRGNLHGYFVMTDLSDARTPNRISHSQFRDNVWYGILSYIPLNVDNVLVADNGSDGMRVSFNYNNANCDIAFLTATANGGWGYVNGNGNPNTVTFANSVFEGNLGGAVFGKPNKFTAEKCSFHGNGADGATDFTAGSEPKLVDPIYGDPLLDTTDTLRGHLGNGSPCAQSGVNKAFTSLGDLVDDLDYTARNAEKVDVGCFISPETMKDLAGHGYHVVSLHGAPNGYGEPNPAYGDHLLKDGPQTIDLSCTLHTDDADGARCYTLSDGVRVAYKGYLAREEGSSQPVESETEETFAFTLRENTDVTVRWELQDRVVVDARAKGCLVKVNDFAAGACVTNWVTHGTAVSVTFLPSDNWTLDQWAGDLPAGTDPKTYTVGWTSDQPRSVYTLAKAVHYVAPTGSDEDGTGEKDRPWRTIGHAIADASVQAGEVINVQAGVYEESVTNATAFGGKDGLTLSGGWDESWTLSPKTAKTVVTPPTGWRKRVPCLYMDTALNTVTYMTFRGGSTGIRALSTKGTANSETSHHEFRGIVVTDCVDGIDFTGCNLGLALEASLVAANDGCGFRHDAANTGYDYVYNCTFAENGATAVERKQNALASGFFRNCVFDRNGRHYWKAGSSNSDTFQNCCFGAATSNLMLHVAIKKTGVTDRKVSFNEKFMCAEPLLDAEYRPTAESPFLGMGTNLVEAAVAPFGSDVEGTLWNGVWDYGCYKSATAPLPKRAELYVSVDGDDANDGTAPERAKRTIGGAIAHAAENGVVSVGPGTFDLGNSVYVRGLEIRGAGPLLTKLESDLPFVSGQVETALYGFQFWTSGAKVSGFGVKGAFEGVRTPGYMYAYLNEVANCRFERGFAGVRLGGGNNSGSAPKNTFHAFDRCVIADNVWRGVDAGGTIHLTSSLVVRNGAHGFYGSTGDQFESDYIVNTTFKDNTGTAVESTSGWASGHRFLNCVIAGSTVGVQRTDERYSNGIYLYNCVVDNETNYNKVHNDMLAAGSMGGIYLSTPSIEADPLVKDDGRLEEGSPCLGAGVDPKKVSVTIRPERYLDGKKINYHAGKCAVGCMTIPNGLKIIVK